MGTGLKSAVSPDLSTAKSANVFASVDSAWISNRTVSEDTGYAKKKKL